jgi:hypothetical protein
VVEVDVDRNAGIVGRVHVDGLDISWVLVAQGDVWVFRRYSMEEGRLTRRFTFHGIRGKAGSDSEDVWPLEHENSRTLKRHYQ